MFRVNQLMEAASPFRLIQRCASDDSLDSDAVTIPAKTDTGKSPISSVKPSNFVAKDDQESFGALNVEDSIDYDDNGNRLSWKSEIITAPEGPQSENVFGINDDDSFDLLRKDAKDKSPTRKVDEFGRLVREGGSVTVSDSDDDSPSCEMVVPGHKQQIQMLNTLCIYGTHLEAVDFTYKGHAYRAYSRIRWTISYDNEGEIEASLVNTRSIFPEAMPISSDDYSGTHQTN
ncbi:hypothetical protein FXO38_22207 [Capsicum annuum]|uniref:Uncharacterized protein n=1 Tax=Capsicum annuum TaxID=4072 RepID=A0A2G2ZCH4_CAPAN|nr:hypothetical protein FXO37_35113 [Capsicum annuum]KAF3640252.1 hypothetical protein FXO38_22207 [Capsicum annuum]PHT79585.1 hypothetical protein T459_17637 [Capsicum annuum]